jgi:hypothetical protein
MLGIQFLSVSSKLVGRPNMHVSVPVPIPGIVDIVIIVWAFVSFVLIPAFMKLPSQRKKFAQMDDRKLVEANVRARMMQRSLHLTAYLGLLPFLYVYLIIYRQEVTTNLPGLVLMVFLVGDAGARFFRKIELLAMTELEFRKFKKDEDTRNKTSEATSKATLGAGSSAHQG